MNSNDNNSSLILCIAFLVVLLPYFLFSIKYIITFLCSKNKRFMIYWVDFIIGILVILIFTIFELFLSLQKPLINRGYMIMIIGAFGCSNILINLFNSCFLLYQMYSLKKINIKTSSTEELIQLTNNINATFLYTKSHLLLYFLSITLNGFVFYVLYHYIGILYQFIYLISLFGLELLLVAILSHKYNLFMRENYFCQSMINEKIFNKTKKKIFVITEHLLYITVFDKILLIPYIFDYILIGIDNKTVLNDSAISQTVIIIIYNSLFYLYILFFGSLILTIDYQNKIVIPKGMYYLFLLPFFKYQFNTKKNNHIQLFNPITINLNNVTRLNSIDESAILTAHQDPDSSSNSKTQANKVKIRSKSDSFVDSFLSVQSNNYGLNKDEYIKMQKNHLEQIYKVEKEFLPCNFYIIFKIIYLFFKSNEKIYLKVEKSVEEEGIPFRNQFRSLDNSSSGISKPFFAFNSENIKDNINRISRISITNKERLISVKKLTLEQLMNSINDKLIKEDFIKYLVDDGKQVKKDFDNKNKIISTLSHNKIEFAIESLFNDILFEIFPFYQLNINDILTSLDVNNNKGLFRVFFEKKFKDKRYNGYYTRDSFLSFEIYDEKILPFKKIKDFISNYKNYLMDRITNFSFTFLPLIIGIFNIRYLNYNKIIVFYRNPLSFAPLVSFNCWINFCFSDNLEKITTSTKDNEVVDINEIEVKNNILLEEEEYNETFKILKSDMKFLKEQDIELNFKLHLFVVNDMNKNESKSIFDNKDIYTTNIIDDKAEEKFINMLRDTTLFNENLVQNMKKAKKYHGSDVVSLLEKLYFNNVVDNKYMFKIYFSELFRRKNIFQRHHNTVSSRDDKHYDNENGVEFQRFTNFNDLETIKKNQNNKQDEISLMNKKFCKK